MATRLYFTTRMPRVRIDDGAKGTWHRQAFHSRSWSKCQWTWLLDTSKTLSGELATRACRTNQQGNYDSFFARWMSRPLSGSGTLSGTFDFIAQVSQAWEDDVDPPSDQVDVVWKVHVYVTVGETATVRGVALDNYVDGNLFPFNSGGGVRGVAITQQTLTATGFQDGDCIMVEIGERIISSPTPAVTYPPTNQSFMPTRIVGCTGGFPTFTEHPDMAVGDSLTTRAPWCEFSANLTFKAPSSAPANETCATAIVIPPTLPYSSSLIDTTGGTQTDQEVFWSWTAPANGEVMFTTLGGNNGNIVRAFTGDCAALANISGEVRHQNLGSHRSMASSRFTAVQGTVYTIRVRTTSSTAQAPAGGGVVKLNAFYIQAPDTDDVYIPAGWVIAFRPSIGALVNVTPASWLSNAPTSCVIDYTRRPLDDLSHGSQNTNIRLGLGLHNFDLLEWLDIDDLQEVNFIGDPWETPPFTKHTAQAHMMRDGNVVVGWYGNGYSFVNGIGTLPAILSRVSSDPIYSDIRVIDALHADLAAGAPWPAATRLSAAVQITATPFLSVDEDAGAIYYVSSGFYEPVGGNIIKRITTAGVQMADLVTLALQGVNNPGLKGLQVVGDSIFICNGIVGHRLNKLTGAITQTYTPSVSSDAQSLCDVKVSADGLEVYFFDEDTTTLFRFNIATAAETGYWPLMIFPGTFTQMAIFQETPPEIELEIPECPLDELIDDPEPDTGLERFFETHGYGVVGSRGSDTVLSQSALESEFSGILGSEVLGEFVLGDEGLTVTTNEADTSCIPLVTERFPGLKGLL